MILRWARDRDKPGVVNTDAAFSSAAANSTSLSAAAPQLAQLVQELQAREAQLTAALAESSQRDAAQKQLLDKLTHELALMKRWIFGARPEPSVRTTRVSRNCSR